MLSITSTLSLDESELEERFVRSSGPGGQNVNKVATAVQLRLNVKGSSLPDAIKERLSTLAGSRMTDDGVLVIDAREHRTQSQNRDAARERLIALSNALRTSRGNAARRGHTKRPRNSDSKRKSIEAQSKPAEDESPHATSSRYNRAFNPRRSPVVYRDASP